MATYTILYESSNRVDKNELYTNTFIKYRGDDYNDAIINLPTSNIKYGEIEKIDNDNDNITFIEYVEHTDDKNYNLYKYLYYMFNSVFYYHFSYSEALRKLDYPKQLTSVNSIIIYILLCQYCNDPPYDLTAMYTEYDNYSKEHPDLIIDAITKGELETLLDEFKTEYQKDLHGYTGDYALNTLKVKITESKMNVAKFKEFIINLLIHVADESLFWFSKLTESVYYQLKKYWFKTLL
jgi:hypothetical protein